nr:ATP-binding protein [uncultured Blautia sp.]
MRSGDLASYAGKKIGTVNEQRMVSYIKKWVSENDVDVEICYYNNITECAEDFNNGKLDGYVSADNIVSSYTGITPVELIGKEPYYLAVAKDREDLLKDLNATLSVIQEQNAFYLDELQNKYSTESSVNIFLSRQEQEWMENHSKITVGYLNNYLPYSATDAKGEVTGLIADAVPDIIRTLPGKYRPGVTYQGFDDQQEMMEALNLTQLIQDVMDIMSVQAVSTGLSLTHETEEEQLGTWPDIMGNPVQLREIFLNIVGNAVKYNKPGGKIEWKDRLTASTDRNVLYECGIADTGIGMEKEYLKHIFEPFSQEHTDARTVYQGTGLGMPIVKTLVERMGGTIEIDSVPGEGSTVYISLPFHVSETVQEIPATEEMEDVPLKGKRILLVEDNDLNLEIAQFLLEDAGAEVITARNGKQAVDTYMAKPSGTYDAILMDIMMPVMNGNEAAQKIRWSGWADARKIPIIAVTACASEENRTASADAGINGYLTKPLDVEKLVSTLVALIRNTTAREECARL